jgi:signal peptidase I
MNCKPNKWVAATLSFLSPPMGMLYANQAKLAGIYFGALLVVGLSEYWLSAAGIKIPLTLGLAIVALVHCYRIAAKAKESGARQWFSRWYGLLGIALSFFTIAAAFRAFLFEPFNLPAQSMFPSIPKGAFVVVDKYGYGNYSSYGIHFHRGPITAPLNRGDVLVFEFPRDRSVSYVKRLVGLPGDHIEYKNKRLYLNGTPLTTTSLGGYEAFEIAQESTYRIATDRSVPAQDFDVIVDPGHLFVLGDNRDKAHDSRVWGQVPEDHVIGKVILVLNDPKVQPIISPDLAHKTAQGH